MSALGERGLEAPGFDIRPLDEDDAADVLTHFGDPRVVEFLDIDPQASLDEALATIAWARARQAAGAGVRWAVRERASGDFVGTCGFNALIYERGRRGEVAYDLSARWWGRGVMTAIMPALVEFGFGALGLHRLEAMVTPGNDRSCALLERHGFMREGVLAGFGFWKGRYWDQIVYGLTREAAGRTFGPGPDGRAVAPILSDLENWGGKSGLHGDKAAGNARRG